MSSTKQQRPDLVKQHLIKLYNTLIPHENGAEETVRAMHVKLYCYGPCGHGDDVSSI